jgi:hypothetical protein
MPPKDFLNDVDATTRGEELACLGFADVKQSRGQGEATSFYRDGLSMESR